MSSRIFFAIVLVSLTLGRSGVPSSPTEPPLELRSGALVIVGGGGTPDGVKARALQLAGGAEARVLVFAQASQRKDSGAGIARMWRDVGAEQVRIGSLAKPEESRVAIEQATLIWFGGGSQNRLMRALGDAGLIETIRKRHRAGAVVGGSSAGAAVLSDPMVSGGVTGSGILAGGTELVPGLGLAPGMIVDQHFLVRRRFQRLCSAVLDRPDLLGVGIDEKTAIIVTPGRFEVLGEGAVVVLDARAVETGETAKGEVRAFANLVIHQLVADQHFDLEERRPSKPESR